MAAGDVRPLSPHLQVYRPQLTSVLSFAHRVTGILLGVCTIALVGWVIAAALGPRPYASAQAFLRSWIGQALLVAGVFSFFLHPAMVIHWISRVDPDSAPVTRRQDRRRLARGGGM